MSQYFDAIVIPVPRANLDTYKQMSAEWGKAHLRHGALYYSDSISDDAQPGKVTSFPQAVQLKDGEVIALAWVVYRNKEDATASARRSWRIRNSRSRWTPRRCPSTVSACSGVGSRASSGSRPEAKSRPINRLAING